MGGSKAFPDPKVQAAELKKRLLRNKGQGNSTSTNTSTTARISPATDTSPKSHPAPQSQPQPQFRAESAEIDALIKAHSNPDQPNRNTSSADHEPSDTTSEMLAQKGEFTADKPSTMLGRLGKYAITNGDTTQVTDELSGALVNKNTTAVINQLEDDDANDLHEWLNLTGFYDRQARKKKLERSRKLAQFEAEERRIRIESARVKADQERLELERRKLMDEDGDEALPTPPLAQTPQATSKTCTRATDLQQQSEEGPATKLPDEQASLPAVPADAPQKGENGKKDGTKDEAAARDKHVDMMDRNTDTRAPRPSSRAGHNDMGMHHGRDLSRRSASPSFGCDGLGYDNNEEGYERNYGHNSYRDNTSGEHRGGSNHRGTDWYRMPSPHHGAMAYPKHVDLGGRGETRFFIVKSFTHDNVKQCMEDGTWATHRQHEKLFSDAFLHCKNVILVFSVNQSRAFQGYARMMSLPSADVPQPYWMKFIHWETTLPFRVDWLSTVEMPFVHFGHLKNSLNEDASVMVGKNGQEIEEECGRRLLDVMQDINWKRYEDQEYHKYRDRRSPRAYRDAGGFRTGDHNGRFSQGGYNDSRQP